jgi:uncharacterized membrane protein
LTKQQFKSRSATGSPPSRSSRSSELAPVLDRNIESLHRRREREESVISWQAKIALAIGRFVGSMMFVYAQIIFVIVWLTPNLGIIPRIRPWDNSLIGLATIASIEAIFLTTFVLINQNIMTAAAGKRADLDLQISLLTEHEITKLTTLVAEMAKKMKVKTEVDHELEEIKRDVAPDLVLDKIENKTIGNDA